MTAVRQVEKPIMRTIGVAIRARAAIEVRPGEWDLQIEVAEVTEHEGEMLERLFPHSQRDIQHLLDKEAIISAIIKPGERR